MARTMTVDNTEIYRALVSEMLPSGKVMQNAYGPQACKAHARDHDARWRVRPTRVEKQQLLAGVDFSLGWITIETKYDNGGEDVNWDD